jgi:hypothetical protein
MRHCTLPCRLRITLPTPCLSSAGGSHPKPGNLHWRPEGLHLTLEMKCLGPSSEIGAGLPTLNFPIPRIRKNAHRITIEREKQTKPAFAKARHQLGHMSTHVRHTHLRVAYYRVVATSPWRASRVLPHHFARSLHQHVTPRGEETVHEFEHNSKVPLFHGRRVKTI